MANQVQKVLEQAAACNMNVLINGAAGTGKTSMIKAVFNKVYGPGNYLIISAATIDPYADLVGIPWVVDTVLEDGTTEKRLGYMRPDVFKPNIRAVFFDEANRGEKKVVNAMMELIQFKSVNGVHTGVEVVWGATNPDDMTDELGRQVYHVSHLDPAHLDRFHLHIDVKPELDADFFRDTFGKEVFKVVSEWWRSIDNKVKEKEHLSPRRVEYAIRGVENGIDAKYILPASCDPQGFTRKLSSISLEKKWNEALAANDSGQITGLINGTTGTGLMSIVDARTVQTYFKYLNPDRLSKCIEEAPDKFCVKVDDMAVRKSLMEAALNLQASVNVSKFIDANSDTYDLPASLFTDVKRQGLQAKVFSRNLDTIEDGAAVLRACHMVLADNFAQTPHWMILHGVCKAMIEPINRYPELAGSGDVRKMAKVLADSGLTEAVKLHEFFDSIAQAGYLEKNDIPANISGLLG